jgi:hypothetical protein
MQLQRFSCNGSCISITEAASSPLYCGASMQNPCGRTCNQDEVCVAGQCTAFFPSKACTTCPCAACGSENTCCEYPGTTTSVCVSGTVCPK